jgi:hypothetical protein
MELTFGILDPEVLVQVRGGVFGKDDEHFRATDI